MGVGRSRFTDTIARFKQALISTDIKINTSYAENKQDQHRSSLLEWQGGDGNCFLMEAGLSAE